MFEMLNKLVGGPQKTPGMSRSSADRPGFYVQKQIEHSAGLGEFEMYGIAPNKNTDLHPHGLVVRVLCVVVRGYEVGARQPGACGPLLALGGAYDGQLPRVGVDPRPEEVCACCSSRMRQG